uniref:Ribosomal protein L9 domain-containing protein n=2 Tax=Phytophthora ramorum TaxID=164328 RepID=H3GS25_PHYRM
MGVADERQQLLPVIRESPTSNTTSMPASDQWTEAQREGINYNAPDAAGSFVVAIAFNGVEYGVSFTFSLSFPQMMFILGCLSVPLAPAAWIFVREEKIQPFMFGVYISRFWRTLQQRAVCQLAAYDLFSGVLNNFNPVALRNIKLYWVHTTPFNASIMTIIGTFVYTGTLGVMAQRGLNWNWRCNQWLWLGTPIIQYIPHAVQFIVDNLVIVELIELGSEGALFGLLSTTNHIATPFGCTAARLINSQFHVWKDDIIADTYTTRRDVTVTILICYGMKLLSLVFLPLLPSQKAATQELRRCGGTHRRMAGPVALSSSETFLGIATPRLLSDAYWTPNFCRISSISLFTSRMSMSSDRFVSMSLALSLRLARSAASVIPPFLGVFLKFGLSKMLARSTTKLVSVLQRPQGVQSMLARSFAHRVNMVLKEDVSNLGHRGDEVSVKAGYARNFLYPEKLAVYATDVNREKFKVDKESVDESLLEKEHELEYIVHRLSNVDVVFKRHTASKADAKLHSEVNAQNISDMLEKQHGLIVGVARIDLPTPIKTLGEHTVKVRVDDAIEEEYAAGVVVSAAESEAEVEAEAEGDADKKQKKGPSKKKWVSLAIEVERRTKSKKTPAKTTQQQQRKPGITTKPKAKPTQHIVWRGKQITEFG